MRDLKIGDEIVYVQNFFKYKKVIIYYVVTKIKENSVICNRFIFPSNEKTNNWTEIPKTSFIKYEKLEILKQKYPQYFI
jgi:hypothetical protein